MQSSSWLIKIKFVTTPDGIKPKINQINEKIQQVFLCLSTSRLASVGGSRFVCYFDG